jgi:hypothetical protein
LRHPPHRSADNKNNRKHRFWNFQRRQNQSRVKIDIRIEFTLILLQKDDKVQEIL